MTDEKKDTPESMLYFNSTGAGQIGLDESSAYQTVSIDRTSFKRIPPGHDWPFWSQKEYINLGSVMYAQHLADSHCHFEHGYSLSFRFKFIARDLDARNWCVDFGSLKPFKDFLEQHFDHTTLVASDNPRMADYKARHARKEIKMVEVERVGCEGLAHWLYVYLNDPKTGFLRDLGYATRVWCSEVEVRETLQNSAGVQGYPETWWLFDPETPDPLSLWREYR